MCVNAKDLTGGEGRKIQEILRKGKDIVYTRRCRVILFSAQGMKVKDIVKYTYLCEDHIRRLIKIFNEEGLKGLKPKKRKGREVVFTEEYEAEIAELALMPPQIAGYPFTQWSLSKLKEAIISRGIVKNISIETIRQILMKNKIKYRRTKTWKESKDPELESKKNE